MVSSYSQAFAREIGRETGFPLPRFIILKTAKTNLRKGPGIKYPISWIYLKKGYPMEVIAEYENWRKIKDIDGKEGWVNENLITGKRNAIIIDNKLFICAKKYYTLNPKEALIFRHSDENSYPIAKVEVGAIVSLKKCDKNWCKIKADGYTGWIKKENLWGVYKDEEFN